MSKLKDLIKNNYLFYILLILAIIIRIFWFNQIHDFDETQYALEAMHIVNGEYNPNFIYYNQGVRYTFLLPLASIFWIFGFSNITMVVYSFTLSILQVVLLYYFANLFFNKRVAVFAVLLLAIFPLDIVFSTKLEADMALSFYMTLTVFIYFFKPTKINAFFSGLILGFAFFTKEFAILLIFFLGIYELIYTKSLKRLMYVLLGFIIIITLFFGYQYYMTGDLLYNIHVQKDITASIIQFKNNPPNITFEQTPIGFKTLENYFFNIFLTVNNNGNDAKLNIYYLAFFICISTTLFYYK